MLIKIMKNLQGWKPKWTEKQEEMVQATRKEMLKSNDIGKMWRNNLKDELKKPMKPVHGRRAFLKSLGFLEGALQLNLVEFDRLYRLEKDYPPLEVEV